MITEAQYQDGTKKWIPIPAIGRQDNPDRLAYAYCIQHGLVTRVVTITEGVDKDGKSFKEEKIVKTFKVTKRR